MLKNVEWGKYKIENLFESYSGNFDIKKEHINNKGEYVITSGLTDRGILGKTNIKAKIFNEKTITIDMFGYAFYRNFKYKMVTHARVFSLKPKFEISDNQGLFLANSFHFMNGYFGYEKMCTWQKIKEKEISLPTKNGEIDFDFMEKFIEELEKEKIKKLEKYLEENNLKNYELTSEEKKVLEDFESGKIEWEEFKLNDLFEIKSSKKIYHANKINKIYDKKLKNSFSYIVRTTQNNGNRGYIIEDKKYLNEENTLSFAQDTFSVFYQKHKYFTGNKVKILIAKFKKNNELVMKYLTASFQKSLNTLSWGTGSTINTIAKTNIQLPIKNNNPDYELMETLILAVQKIVVKSVVKYINKKN